MKQTAVEWFVEQMKTWGDLPRWMRDDIVNKAKKMEKESHKETWDVSHQAGRFEGKGIAEENWQTFEGYWKENFKQEEQ